jgi:methylated-DNA-[protein]-cysteine S-methyltransferase
MAWYDVLDSPLGPIFAGGSAEGIHRLDFLDAERDVDVFVGRLERETGETVERDSGAASEAARQLREYFAGARVAFELPLAAQGTPFQQRVWQALRAIPPGETRSYGAIADAIGRPGASRAVGAANGRNPIAVVVPCHRVIGSDGSMTGYASGVERKRWLLEHERGMVPAAGPQQRLAV